MKSHVNNGHTVRKEIVRAYTLKHNPFTLIFQKITCSLLLLCLTAGYTFSQSKLSAGDHVAAINGNKIHYFVSGKGPVCLAPSPGWGVTVDYLRMLKPFEKHFTMVYYDTRLTGTSTGPDDPTKYTGQDLLNDMDSLRVYLEQPRVWLTGHSGGGFQVLNYGTQHNDHLYGIISLDAQAVHDSISQAEMMATIEKRKDAPYYTQAKGALFGIDGIKHTPEEMLGIILPLYFHDVNKMSRFPKDLHVSAKAFEYSNTSKMFSKNLLPELHKITVPVLVYVGDDDFICGVSQSTRIHENIPSSELVIVKDSGHFPWVEQPEQFYAAFEKWIKKQHL